MRTMTAPSMEVVRFGAEDIIATSEIMHWEVVNKSDGTWNYNKMVTADGNVVTDKNEYKDVYNAVRKYGWSKAGNHNKNGVDDGILYYHDDGWVVFIPETD